VDYQATFSQDGDHTSIDFLVQYPHNGTDANGLDFYGFVNGELVAFFPRINWRTEMRDALSSFRFAGPLVFQGTTFPNFKWPSADEQTSLFGNESKFSIKYWNDQYEPVSMADKPGRYGAVVEISNGQSIVARRMMTLCRVPDSIGGWNLARDGMDALPNTVALLYRSLPPSPIPPASTDLEIPFNPARAYPDDPIYSMYLANLSESSPSATPGLADHEWWVGFRHRFYGFEKKYPNLLARLAPTTAPSEESSPMLREGTPAEAGMKDDVVDKLDALFSSGVNEFPDEPLAVCVAHNGVVFFHRAYGKLEDGSNMTVEVPTLTSAIGKVITGIVAMEFIDRGFLNLDRPLDEYVPAFAMVHKSDFGDTLTLHYFFTHQAGLERWARQFNDIEEVVANQGPFLRKGYTYSSVGYFCAGSIMEEMSGQPFRVLTKKLVFEPLGMLNAEQPSPDGDGTMSVLDLAKMGQMLLNHGTYGHVRLVSEKSFQQMLPKPGWGVRGGIGLEQAGAGIVEGDAILPPDSIGHAAINSGVFEVIPSKNLVIVVGAMRHRPGAFATKYQEKVFEAILSSIK
jgi:CubicO group peptidase (beta-lactamase class C family)